MYVRFLCTARSKDVTVNAISGTLEFSVSGDDLEETYDDVSGATPILRNGIKKDGSVRVLVMEYTNAGSTPAQATIQQSLATLLGLRSPVGFGDYTVYVNGTIVSYNALIDVDMSGTLHQFVTIAWRGSIAS